MRRASRRPLDIRVYYPYNTPSSRGGCDVRESCGEADGDRSRHRRADRDPGSVRRTDLRSGGRRRHRIFHGGPAELTREPDLAKRPRGRMSEFGKLAPEPALRDREAPPLPRVRSQRREAGADPKAKLVIGQFVGRIVDEPSKAVDAAHDKTDQGRLCG